MQIQSKGGYMGCEKTLHESIICYSVSTTEMLLMAYQRQSIPESLQTQSLLSRPAVPIICTQSKQTCSILTYQRVQLRTLLLRRLLLHPQIFFYSFTLATKGQNNIQRSSSPSDKRPDAELWAEGPFRTPPVQNAKRPKLRL